MSLRESSVTLLTIEIFEINYEIFMNEAEQEFQKNRKLIYAIMIFAVLTAALTFKFYRDQKKENQALKIKILTLNKTRSITPWEGLISRSQISPTSNPSEIQKDEVSTKLSSTITSPITPTSSAKAITLSDDRPIQNLSTTELANALDLRMIEMKSLDQQGLEKNIEIADEIISREPDSYSAYKAKLVSLLVLEGKFNQEIEDNEVFEILETMASFDLSGDIATQREAILIRNATDELSKLESAINDIATKRQALEAEMELLEPNTPENRAAEIERLNFLRSEEETASKIVELNAELESGFTEDQYLNEDIVQIPFLRLLAKEDYEEVIDNAQSFIEQFPNSPEGYYFLIKAYELTGRNDDALRVNEDPRLSTATLNIVRQRLKDFPNFDPKKYWEKLNF